jgi:hypothetical protein
MKFAWVGFFFLFPLSLLSALLRIDYYQSSPWGERLSPLAFENSRAPLPPWLLKVWENAPYRFEVLYYQGALYSVSLISVEGGERISYPDGTSQEKIFDTEGNLLQEITQVNGQAQKFTFHYQEGRVRGYESLSGEREITFRADGTLRAISGGSERVRLGEDTILLDSPELSKEWIWQGREEISQSFSPQGVEKQFKHRYPLPQGEWIGISREGVEEIRSRYSPLGWLLGEEVWEKGELVTQENWRYNDSGQIIAYQRETKTDKEEIRYEWQGEDLKGESLFQQGRLTQKTSFTADGRTLERFSRGGESLGTFYIRDEETW